MYIKSFVSKVLIRRLHKTTEVTLFHNLAVTYAARIHVADKSYPTVGGDANKAFRYVEGIFDQSAFQNVFDSPLACHI